MPFPKSEDSLAGAAIKGLNELRRAQVGANVHASRTVASATGDSRDPTVNFLAVAAAAASNEATLVTLCKELRIRYAMHLADKVGHKVADTVDVVAAAEPTTTATCITWLNEAKADYNLHIASTTYHYTADAANGIIAADATNEATAITLANEMRTDFPLHWAAALAGFSIQAEV